MRVLVVEDELVSREILVHTVRETGHEAVPAENGKIAWEILNQEPIKIVIADWTMPEMDGIELLKRIRSADREHYTYVILLSSRIEREDRLAGLEAGADDYVDKPFDPEELMLRVRAGERIIRLEEQLAGRIQQLRRFSVLVGELRQLSLLDELTRVGNRRAFEEAYRRLLAQSNRYSLPFALAMIDIDKFKIYNDSFGHEAGDRVLKQIAEVLRENTRTADMLFRYGGEEFVCLFPMTDVDGARAISERLRAQVEQAAIPHPENKPHGVVTISLGYACPGLDGSEQSGEELLRQADKALYRCKMSGRNQVIFYDGTATEAEEEGSAVEA